MHVFVPTYMYLSYGDCLLLHDLVNGGSIGIQHLVKLINAAHSLVCQNESSSFQDHLSRHRVLHHRSCQTNTRAATTSGVLT